MAGENDKPAATPEEVKLTQQIADNTAKIAENTTKSADARKLETLQLQRQQRLEEEIKDARNIKYKEIISEIEELKKKNATGKESLDLVNKEIEALLIKKAIDKENGKFNEEQHKKELEQLQKRKETLRQTNNLEIERKQILDGIFKVTGAITGGFTEQLRQFFSLNDLTAKFGSFVTEIIESQRELISQTGKTDILNPKLFDASRRELAGYGIGLKELSRTFADLDSSYSNFSNLNDTVRHQLADQAVKFTNLGVSAKEQGKVFQEFSRGLGMSATQSAASLDRILVAAKQAGVSPQRAIADLGSAMGQLSSHGRNAEKVFIELQKQSKQLGLEMGSMLGIVGKGFDTFEGAADKAGRLNALLGGDFLNSVEMLNATEDERINIMRRAFEQSGKNFDQMDRFEKKAIANALGLKDEAEARKLLGKLSVEEQLNLKKEETARRELEEAQRNSADTMRLLQLSLSEFMIAAAPVAQSIQKITHYLAEHSEIVRDAIIAWGALYLAFKGFSIIAGVAMWIAQFTAAIRAAGATATPASTSIASGITAVGQAATASVAGLLTLAVVIVSIGASIAIASLGLAKLVESFGTLKEGQFVPALIGIGVALGGITLAITAVIAVMLAASAASLAAAPGLGIFVGVILAIGAAIGMAAAGIGYMVEKFALLFNSINSEKIGLFYALATAIGSVGLAFAAFALTGPFAAIGMATFAGAVVALGKAINDIPTDANFKAKVDVLSDIGDVLKITTTVRSEQINPSKEFVDSATEFYKAQKESKESDKDALVSALKQVMTPAKEAGVTETAVTPVVIKLEDVDIKGNLHGIKITKLLQGR